MGSDSAVLLLLCRVFMVQLFRQMPFICVCFFRSSSISSTSSFSLNIIFSSPSPWVCPLKYDLLRRMKLFIYFFWCSWFVLIGWIVIHGATGEINSHGILYFSTELECNFSLVVLLLVLQSFNFSLKMLNLSLQHPHLLIVLLAHPLHSDWVNHMSLSLDKQKYDTHHSCCIKKQGFEPFSKQKGNQNLWIFPEQKQKHLHA